MSTTTPMGHIGLLLTFLWSLVGIANAFTPLVPIQQCHSFHTPTLLSASSIPFTIWDALPKIRTMSKSDMKQELESYGVSAEGLSSKKEVTRALQKARRAQASSKVSITDEPGEEQQQDASSSDKKWSASGFFETYDPVNFSHESEHRDGSGGWKGPNIWNMHTGDMRKELEQEFGISTENLLERRQLARALEDARMERSTRRRRRHHHEEGPGFWSASPDATRPHDSYAHEHDDPYEQHPPPPPPHSYSPYEQQGSFPKNEYVNYAYAGSNGGDFYKASATVDFLDNEDIVDAEVESVTTPHQEESTETKEAEMHRYDPRASYMGLIIDTDISP